MRYAVPFDALEHLDKIKPGHNDNGHLLMYNEQKYERYVKEEPEKTLVPQQKD
jgi:hypothetical protein